MIAFGMVIEIVIFERVNGCIHKRMQGRRLKYLDPISSPCEDIGELKYRPQKSTFNAGDRELLSVTRVIGGIEKVCLLTKSFAAAYLTVFFSVAAATATDSLIT